MKTISKTTTLRLEKFQIAKLNNLSSIIGGNANNSKHEKTKTHGGTIRTSGGDTFTTTGG